MKKNGFTPIIILFLGVFFSLAAYGIYRSAGKKTGDFFISREESNQPFSQDAAKKPTIGETFSSEPLRNQSGSGKVATKVGIFFIATDDQGQLGKMIGCGDSVVGVEKTIDTNDQDVIKDTLQLLFSEKSQYYSQSGLYNSLANSNLQIDSVSVSADKATVNLSGTYSFGGACDNPRFQAQIEETVLQFPTVKEVSVFVNQIPLEKILSGQG